MIEINLQTDSPEQEAIKQYLQENVSWILADKINNGTPIAKDGKPLINKKTLTGFMLYAADKAKKLTEKGAKYACILSDTVFGWAIHYFEEDSIEGSLFTMDGTEYKPEPKAKPQTITPVTKAKVISKADSYQVSVFDMADEKEETDDDELKSAIKGQIITEDGEIIDYEDFDGDIEEEVQEEPKTAQTVIQSPVGSPVTIRLPNVDNNTMLKLKALFANALEVN